MNTACSLAGNILTRSMLCSRRPEQEDTRDKERGRPEAGRGASKPSLLTCNFDCRLHHNVCSSYYILHLLVTSHRCFPADIEIEALCLLAAGQGQHQERGQPGG